METLTHWKKLHNPDYLGSYSLDPGKDLTLKIMAVKKAQVNTPDGKKEECTVAYFDGGHKPMILNVTNCKTISANFDTPYIEQWAGKSITVFSAKVKAFGEMVEALRVRVQKDKKKEELKPGHAKWDGAMKAMKEGSTDIDSIEFRYFISPENIEKLCGRSK